MFFKQNDFPTRRDRRNKGKRKLQPKIVMRLPHCFECIQDSYKGLMGLLYASVGITHRTENGRNIKKLKMVKYQVSQETNMEDSRKHILVSLLILGKIQDKRWSESFQTLITKNQHRVTQNKSELTKVMFLLMRGLQISRPGSCGHSSIPSFLQNIG